MPHFSDEASFSSSSSHLKPSSLIETNEKLAYYATPPLSPAGHRVSSAGSSIEKPLGRFAGMEGSGQRRYEQNSYESARGYSLGNRSGSESINSNSERYRATDQVPPTTLPSSSVGASTSSHNPGLNSYAYTQGHNQYAPQMQDSPLQYRADYPQDTQRQSYPTLSSNMIYTLPPQAQQSADYDVQQFQPRQSAAIEALSNQFSVPQYYNAGEPTSAPASAQQSYATASYQQQNNFQQSARNSRSTNSPPYSASIADYSQINMASMHDQSDSLTGRRGGEDTYATYMESLKMTFQETQQGRLVDAGRRLLELSDWVVSHANDLGLTRDEPGLHDERISFWNSFNTCWLGVLQRQKDITQDMIDSGQPLRAGQTLLQEDTLERMAGELVRMCDGLERHGLVDYQMGVWEEEIMNILLECLHLLEGDPYEPGASDPPNLLPPLGRASR